jgi:glycosyltransferase involved in cell wall biosynthesis
VGGDAMKVLLIYESRDVPSTTVRGLQFRDCFRADPEIEATFIGRTSEGVNAVMRHWPGRPIVRRPATATESLVRRARERRIVELARQADVAIMLTVPSWSLHCRLAELPRTKLVTDLIDALWLPCFQSRGWDRIEEMLASSDAVICENEYTAAHTRRHNGRVFVLPDAPQVEVFDRWRSSVERDEQPVRIGWIGGKYTADALYRVFEPLERLFASRDRVHLRLLGADPDRIPRFEKVRYSVVPHYDQHTMVREALAMHVGLFPMFHVDESLYRGTLKTRVYQAAGAAVVGERWGENEELIREGVNGLLASDAAEWSEGLKRLVDDAQLRQRLAAGGLETVRQGYTRERCYRRLREVLFQLVD